MSEWVDSPGVRQALEQLRAALPRRDGSQPYHYRTQDSFRKLFVLCNLAYCGSSCAKSRRWITIGFTAHCAKVGLKSARLWRVSRLD